MGCVRWAVPVQTSSAAWPAGLVRGPLTALTTGIESPLSFRWRHPWSNSHRDEETTGEKERNCPLHAKSEKAEISLPTCHAFHYRHCRKLGSLEKGAIFFFNRASWPPAPSVVPRCRCGVESGSGGCRRCPFTSFHSSNLISVERRKEERKKGRKERKLGAWARASELEPRGHCRKTDEMARAFSANW